MKENEILDTVERIKDKKVMIVHVRYDLMTPLKQAYDLHKAIPHSKLVVTSYDGHKIGADGNLWTMELADRLIEEFKS